MTSRRHFLKTLLGLAVAPAAALAAVEAVNREEAGRRALAGFRAYQEGLFRLLDDYQSPLDSMFAIQREEMRNDLARQLRIPRDKLYGPDTIEARALRDLREGEPVYWGDDIGAL